MRLAGIGTLSFQRRRRNRRAFYAFIAPWLFGIVFLSLFPLLWGLVFSFSNYTGLTLRNMRWVGFENYIEALGDAAFRHGLTRTAVITVIAVPLKVGLGLMLALQMQKVRRGVGVFRTLLYIPVMLPIVAQVFIWNAIFHPTAGFLNGLLNVFLDGVRINWVADYSSTLLIALFTWGVGETVVIFFAALMTLPDDLLESAQLDGATRFALLRHVKLPLMSPIVFLQVVMNLVKSLQLLTPAMLLIPPGAPMARSGRLSTLEVPTPNRLALIHIYEEAFVHNRFGYSLSLSWIFFVLTALVGVLFWRVSRNHIYYETDID